MSRKSAPATYQVLESLIVKLAECANFMDRKGKYADSVYPAEDAYSMLGGDLTPEESAAFRRITGREVPQTGDWPFEGAFSE